MRSWKLAVVLTGQVAFFVSLPFLLQANNIDTLGLPAFGWAVGWLFAFAAVGTAAKAVGSEQRRFAQSTLGKYLPVRSEERRGGKECVSTCRSQRAQYHCKKKLDQQSMYKQQ